METSSQQIFDTVVDHLRKQNSKSVMYNKDGSVELRWNGNVDNPICLYRSKDGKKCAAGVVITDEEYRPEMEGKNISAVISMFVLDHLKSHEVLLKDLQDVHDNYVVSVWEERFRGLANKYSLTYTPPTP